MKAQEDIQVGGDEEEEEQEESVNWISYSRERGSVWTKNRTVTILIRFLKSKTKTKPNNIGAVWFS